MKHRKRAAALIITAALALGLLAGCGAAKTPGKPGATPGTAAEGSGSVWRAEKRKIDGLEGNMDAKAAAGDKLYFSTAPGYDAEGENTDSVQLWSVPLEGGTADKLSGYKAMATPEGLEGTRVQIGAIAPSSEGLWLYETVSGTKYNLPENYSGGEDGKYEYAQEVNLTSLRLVDASTGEEKRSVELDKAMEEVKKLSQDMGDSVFMSAMNADDEGNVCVIYNLSAAALFSPEGEFLGALPLTGWWDSVVRLSDGRAAIGGRGDDGYALRPVDFKSKGFGTDISLPGSTSRIFAGSGMYGAGFADNLYIYGVDTANGQTTRLAGMLDCGIDESQLAGIFFSDNGGLYCLVNNYDTDKTELMRLTELDPSEAAKIVTLRLACNWLSPNLSKAVLNFTSSSTTARIEVTDYSQYNNDKDFTAGVTKLNTEIISGNVPDLFVTTDLPMGQYAAKGLLKDIYELIDADGELKRESFMTPVLKALETDGKLYSIAPGFGIVTLVGKSDVVGKDMGWTLAQMQDVIKAHPEAKYILGQGVTRTSVLSDMLKGGLDRYVDWQSGKCSFNSQDFIDVLNFSRLFPEEFTYDELGTSPYQMLADGRQLLMPMEIRDFTDYQTCTAITKGLVTFKGYPTAEGIGNIATFSGDPLSISSTCKDMDSAWKFVRGMLTDDSYGSGRYVDGLPLNVKAYAAAEAEAMKRDTYKDDETGEEKEWPKGSAGWGDYSVDFYAMTREEADGLRSLIDATGRAVAYDQNIMNIINEEIQTFMNGTKTAEQTASLIQDRVSLYVNEQR